MIRFSPEPSSTLRTSCRGDATKSVQRDHGNSLESVITRFLRETRILYWPLWDPVRLCLCQDTGLPVLTLLGDCEEYSAQRTSGREPVVGVRFGSENVLHELTQWHYFMKCLGDGVCLAEEGLQVIFRLHISPSSSPNSSHSWSMGTAIRSSCCHKPVSLAIP